MNFNKGDLVTRISYDNDILFVIHSISKGIATLYGIEIRLEADAPIEDLNRLPKREIEKRKKLGKIKEENSYRLFKQDYRLMKEKREYEATDGYQYVMKSFHLPTRVLHLDGDQTYLKKCIALYQKLGLQINSAFLPEKEMALQIGSLIEKVQPEIVVITGHDAYLRNKGEKKDLRAYRHSKYFVDAVREARKIVPHLDQLIIFAGACQSHFESLIGAGANFASSPFRINIHALDPVYITAKIAYTSFMEKVSVKDVLRNTFTGEKGMGGVETKGLLRTGMPYIEKDS